MPLNIRFKFTIDENIGPILYVFINNRKIGLCACHRKKDRSIWFFGLEKYFCSRCLGIIFGCCIGLLYEFFIPVYPLFWSVILMIPMVVDGVTQLLNYRVSNNYLRLLTGILFGFGIITIFVQTLY